MKLVSFDVWNTLLDIGVMLDEMAVSVAKIAKLCIIDVVDGIMVTRNEVKRRRRNLEGDPRRALNESIELLADLLDVRVEVIKRATAMAVLSVGEDIVLPGAKRALEGVKKMGMMVSVTGNVMFWPGAYTRLILERFGLLKHVDATFFSDEVRAYKPMREMFEMPLRKFKVDPDEAIHVGDTYAEDFEGAINAGMWAALINPEAEDVRRRGERGFEIPNVEGVLEVLKEIMLSG